MSMSMRTIRSGNLTRSKVSGRFPGEEYSGRYKTITKDKRLR